MDECAMNNDSLPMEHEVLDIFGTLQSFIRKAAPLNVDMVLEGETGTGRTRLPAGFTSCPAGKGRWLRSTVRRCPSNWPRANCSV